VIRLLYMKLYTVIPIAKTVGKEVLHYFGTDSIELGSLVSIPLRSKTARGIVIEKQNVEIAKGDIKSARFQLKKITKVESKHFLSPQFLEAAFETANFFATTTGSILKVTIPELVFESAKKNSTSKEIIKKTGPTRERLVIQADDEERFAHYKSFIRGEFAKNKSVFFCLPTVEDIRQAKSILEKGIEPYTVTFHSSMGKREFTASLERVNTTDHPILIIGTVPFLSLQRNDLGSIVLDRENSRGYRTISRPYIDLKIFVANLARSMNVLYLCGDLMLSIETLWHYKNEDYAEFTPLKMRLLSPARHSIINMKSEAGEGEKKFAVLSPELKELLVIAKENNEKVFVFAARKGLSPSVVCGDCGTVVICSNCRSPISLYGQEQKEPSFMCNKCGLERSSMERCIHCDSWKLQTLGIGIEKVEEEIKKLLPQSKVLRIDKESAKTEKKALEIMKQFENTTGSVLIGTELGLFYLKSQVENVAIATIDSLFAIPDFRINEKIFYLLLSMRSRADLRFLIQTRNANEKVLDYATKGNLADFYRLEIDDRKKFSYPPFSLFIKLSLEGRGSAFEKAVEAVAELLTPFNPRIYPSLSTNSKGNSVVNILLRRTSETWPDTELLEMLRSLPPQVAIRVDPESLL
jgi:primosomal protein N'